MTNTNHTPGPWEVSLCQADHGESLVIVPEAGGDFIAKIPGACIGPIKRQRTDRKNAALMAASPDLLEACQWALNTLRDAVACPDGCPEDLEASLVSAISRAKGRTK